MKPLCTLILALAALVAAAAPAPAAVTVEGTGEPAYTNSYGNSQWIRWENSVGGAYRMRIRWLKDGVKVNEETLLVPSSGTSAISWAGVAATLEEGHRYEICVQGEWKDGFETWFSDGPDSCQSGAAQGKRTHTTIDRSPPSAVTELAAGAEHTKSLSMPLKIGFTDADAGPFPSTWLCAKAGNGPCESTYSPAWACSIPADANRNTTFGCTVELPNFPDGPVTVCAVVADGAVPDNPYASTQTGTADHANLSPPSCDTVLLDRAAPTVEVTASKTTVVAGETIAFSSQASDAGTGVSLASARWQWGDGSADAAGSASASHSFAAPGTYTVRFRISDAAGHESVAERVITVTAPAGPGTTPPDQPGDGGGGQPGTDGPGTPGSDGPGTPGSHGPGTDPPATDKPGTDKPATDKPATDKPATDKPGTDKPGTDKPGPDEPARPDPDATAQLAAIEKAVAAAAGGGPVLRTSIGSVTVLAPKRFRLGAKAKRLAVGVRADASGELTLTLVRGKRSYSRLAIGIAPGATTQKLKLPRALEPGTYSLKVAFRPGGSGWSATGSTKIAFAKAKKTR